MKCLEIMVYPLQFVDKNCRPQYDIRTATRNEMNIMRSSDIKYLYKRKIDEK